MKQQLLPGSRLPLTLAATLGLALSSSCTQSDEEIINECVGALEVTVPLTTVPAKVRVEWRYGSYPRLDVVDECTPGPSILLLARRAGALLVNDGSFGYTPPDTFDLKVIDRGDCTGTRPDTTLVDVKAFPVPGEYPLCSHADVTLPSR